jgi:hypothetical protein
MAYRPSSFGIVPSGARRAPKAGHEGADRSKRVTSTRVAMLGLYMTAPHFTPSSQHYVVPRDAFFAQDVRGHLGSCGSFSGKGASKHSADLGEPLLGRLG